jgi:hypothetical protein
MAWIARDSSQRTSLARAREACHLNVGRES